MGGYQVIIQSAGTGYAVDNVLTISGIDLGGTTINDATLTVTSISNDGYGSILQVQCDGVAPGIVSEYYVKVLSPTTIELFNDAELKSPTNALTFNYYPTISKTVTSTVASGNKIHIPTAPGSGLYTPIIFTGPAAAESGSGLVFGQTYYLKTSGSDMDGHYITVSATVDGSPTAVNDYSAIQFTMTRPGDLAYLPRPYQFEQSIVRYVDPNSKSKTPKLYACINSNDDNNFLVSNWE